MPFLDTGFIGGPILVMLFIGGTAGTATHLLIPGLPAGLAFATMSVSQAAGQPPPGAS